MPFEGYSHAKCGAGLLQSYKDADLKRAQEARQAEGRKKMDAKRAQRGKRP
jgi:hypothetical protein